MYVFVKNVRYCCPILIEINPHVLVKLPNIKLQGNPLSDYRVFTDRQTDRHMANSSLQTRPKMCNTAYPRRPFVHGFLYGVKRYEIL
jgi:hypothetical protein